MKPQFTTPCFIRKNTPELREKLTMLGYHVSFSARYEYGSGLFARHGLVTSTGSIARVLADVIDCGTNEQMFLALAALREDSDYMQWFTDGTLWECGEKPSRYMMMEGHKATAEGIVEHFKEK